ncbi:2OG-Fe(II) oxygenase [Rhizorhabdus sp.]|uniref:2OG-Fe(II) oxygenase n=1 Tax=Rhizorhabdus sp. TaxID=1968843 RepID=UPI001B3D008E|nr:2OG-Fe(II) oxygenase [Rhizorhabdus sp.]MBP8232957.1 2OG-Fe(II) oxygenase [Rhizorhabdus sp.]
MDDVNGQDWQAHGRALEERGWARLPGLLDPAHCGVLATAYDDSEAFRSTVVMQRHGFGSGAYRYFGYPLPTDIADLRSALYRRLVPVANRWAAIEGRAAYPEAHRDYLDHCHRLGQARPTPLLLRYGAGDYNRLHQDIYGAEFFPMQVAILLSRPGEDFTGGQFVLTEQRPRMQSRVDVIDLRQGDAVVFAVSRRPVQGSRGHYGAVMRHGVSTIEGGTRFCLGIIFHDAS